MGSGKALALTGRLERPTDVSRDPFETMKKANPPRFGTRLDAGFTLTAEVNPPRGVNPRPLLKRLAPFAGRLDAFNVTDCSLARLRMNHVAFAHLIQQAHHVPVLFHLTCRDMSVLKIHDTLMGAWALGLRSVVCMTGDPPRVGQFPTMKGVFQLNSFQLISLVREMNKGRLHDGTTYPGKPTSFDLGCVANPYSPNLKGEARRLQKKVDAGATFCQTQPIYTRRTLDEFLRATAHVPCKKLIGVLPLSSYENAQAIASHIPDVFMPAEILRRLKKNDTPEEGMAICQELVAEVKDMVDGIHVFPINRFDLLEGVLEVFPERSVRAGEAAASASDGEARDLTDPKIVALPMSRSAGR